MHDIRTLIPKHKDDNSGMPELMTLTETEIAPILPNLLSWIADWNWPIAGEMLMLLARFPQSLKPLLQQALTPAEPDTLLKYWIIVKLLPLLPPENMAEFKPCLARTTANPTPAEIHEEVAAEAKAFLAQMQERI